MDKTCHCKNYLQDCIAIVSNSYSTVCPKKRTTYFQTAVTPLRIVEIKKVGRDSERARADLSDTYNFLSVTQLGAEIFEFKDDPVPKILCKKYWK